MGVLGRSILISVIIVFIAICINNLSKNKKVISLYNIGIILFSIIIVIIFSLTGISPISGFHTDIKINEIGFVPLVGIIKMLQSGLTIYTIANVLGNIIMFTPIGFLIPLLWPKSGSFKKVVMFGAGISLFIEFTQLFLIRSTDIDDVILNTVGVIIGYLVFLVFRKLFTGFSGKITTKSKSIENGSVLWICILVPYIVIVITGFYDRYLYSMM